MPESSQGNGKQSLLEILPAELVPQILDQLHHRTADLARCSLVCKTFQLWATPLLYERIFLRDQTKLRKVFATLAEHEELCEHVKILELRVFPFGLPAEALERLEISIIKSLKRALNLRELYWTRTGSLNDRVFRRLFPHLTSLRTLEFTGDSRGWSPDLLVATIPESLSNISILLPDRGVADKLVVLSEKLGPNLQSLSLLCQHTLVVTDAILSQIAVHARNLRRLSLVGCRGVTFFGIKALLSGSEASITELALEGLKLDWSSSSAVQAILPFLNQVQLLSVTYPKGGSPSDFYRALGDIVQHTPRLEHFTLYALAGSGRAAPDFLSDSSDESGVSDLDEDQSATQILASRGRSLDTSFLFTLFMPSRSTVPLKTLRIYGVTTSQSQLRIITSSSNAIRHLEELVVELYENIEPRVLGELLGKLKRLKTLHVMMGITTSVNLDETALVDLAERCGPELRQIGFRNRVWRVERTTEINPSLSEGSLYGEEVGSMSRQRSKVELKRWDFGANRFPEVMLVVKA